MTYQSHLHTKPLETIKAGKKTIESRLFDEKRRLIQLGDEIEYINRENPDDKIRVKVIGLLRYKNFHDLFSHNDCRKFGGESVEQLESQIKEFYSDDMQEKYSVLGIEFEKL
jgi:Uncharacterized conserved protein